jgi:uncharacterized protein
MVPSPAFLQLAQRAAVNPSVSPCVSVCQMDPDSGLCEGCFRTIDEIAAWSSLSDSAKQTVWQRLVERSQP